MGVGQVKETIHSFPPETLHDATFHLFSFNTEKYAGCFNYFTTKRTPLYGDEANAR